MKKFIVVEGLDQTGKSSAALRLVELLNTIGIPAVYFRTPDSIFTEATKMIRAQSSNRASHFFYHLAMVKFSEAKIRESLKTYYVVCDRYYYSTFAYHMDFESGLKFENVCGLFPDLLFLFVTEEGKRMERISSKENATIGDRLNKNEKPYLEKVEEFLKSFNPRIIDSSEQGIDEVARKMLSLVLAQE